MCTEYACSIPWTSKRIHAAAMYCSDGRVGAQFDDFLTHGLGLPRYDRIALPGGPVVLADYEETHLEDHGIVDNLKFLVDAHELKRVVLIAHENCAFYGIGLGLSGGEMEDVQRHDLAKARRYIREYIGLEQVDLFFARIVEGGVRCASVTCAARESHAPQPPQERAIL